MKRAWLFLTMILAACGGAADTAPSLDAGAPDGAVEQASDGAPRPPDSAANDAGLLADDASPGVPAAVGSQVCSTDGFCWELPTPQGETLNAMWGAAPYDAWAVGRGGVLLRYDGSGFSAGPDLTDQDLLAIHGSASDDVWAVGHGGAVLHYDGSDWSSHDVSALVDASGGAMAGVLYGVFAAAPDAVWAVGHSGAAALIIHYDGEQWINQSLSLQSDRALRAVWGLSREAVWVVGEGGLIRAFDGSLWTAPRAPTNADLLAVHGLAEHDVWAVGENGSAIHWDGRTWTARNAELSGTLRSVRVDRAAPPSSDEPAEPPASAPPDAGADAAAPTAPMGPWFVWVFGDEGKVFRYNGEQWAELPSGSERALLGAARVAEGELLAVGEGGQVLRFVGDARQALSLGSTKNRLSLWGNESALWAVGDEVARRDGAGWRTIERATSRSLYGVWGDGETLWTVGTLGSIERYRDGAFEQVQAPAAGDSWLRAVWGAEASVWVVGQRGLALVAAAGSFLEVETPVRSNLLDVWGDADDHFWAVGESGNVLRWDGTRWLQVPTAAMGGTTQALRAVFGLSGADIWVVGTESTILHWDGQRFEDHSRGARYSLNDVWARSSEEVYAVGSGGTALHYDGQQWRALSSGTLSSLESVWGDADGRVFAAGLDGVVLVRAPTR